MACGRSQASHLPRCKSCNVSREQPSRGRERVALQDCTNSVVEKLSYVKMYRRDHDSRWSLFIEERGWQLKALYYSPLSLQDYTGGDSKEPEQDRRLEREG